MKYFKAYFEAFLSIFPQLGALLLLLSIIAGSPLGLYLLFVCTLVSFAGPIRKLLDK